MTTDYLPIDCDQHSLLELLAMRHTLVAARALDEAGAPMALQGTVRDVLTRSGAEYLLIHDDADEPHAIRLDRLQALYDSGGRLIWRQKTVGH